jgi:hypothetical protein
VAAADAGGRGAFDRQGQDHRRNDADDPRGSCVAQRSSRVFFSERTLHADNAKAIKAASTTDTGPCLQGHAAAAQGQKPEDWEDREQTLFRSTAVGDDMDRPLVKSDGSFTYFAADVAYLYDKFGRGFRRDCLRPRRRPWRLRQAARSPGRRSRAAGSR